MEKHNKNNRRVIPYDPVLGLLVGNVNAALLLQQVRYWWDKNEGKSFFKFLEPCKGNPFYKKGDSWKEELRLTRRKIIGTMPFLGKKLTKGVKKEKTDACFFWYWTDGIRRTHYALNSDFLKFVISLSEVLDEDDELLEEFEDAGLFKKGIIQFLNNKTSFSFLQNHDKLNNKTLLAKLQNVIWLNNKTSFSQITKCHLPKTVDYTVDYNNRLQQEKILSSLQTTLPFPNEKKEETDSSKKEALKNPTPKKECSPPVAVAPPKKKLMNGSLIAAVVEYMNLKTEKNFRTTTKKTRTLIAAREMDGYTLEDFKKVIDNKVSEWKGKPTMDVYLRPETLFGNKFEGYLNQKLIAKTNRNETRHQYGHQISPEREELVDNILG